MLQDEHRAHTIQLLRIVPGEALNEKLIFFIPTGMTKGLSDTNIYTPNTLTLLFYKEGKFKGHVGVPNNFSTDRDAPDCLGAKFGGQKFLQFHASDDSKFAWWELGIYILDM